MATSKGKGWLCERVAKIDWISGGGGRYIRAARIESG